MPKPVGVGPGAGPGNVVKTALTTDTSAADSAKPAKAPEQQQAAEPLVLSEGKKKQAKAQKQMSGVRMKAAVDQAMQTESKGKGKAVSGRSSSSVGAATDVAAPSIHGDAAKMTPVKVNVLAHTPNTNNLQRVGDSVPERLAFFDRMCAKAQAGIPPSALQKGEQQLNLMVAPEWLFARHSSTRDEAYTGKQMQEITEGLQAISKKYPDMLIVGGSVSWEIPDKLDRSKSIMYNSSPVVQNGQIVHMYHKRVEGGETSVSDANKGQVKKAWGMADPAIRSKIEHSNPSQPTNSSIFTHQGITFSMEICADHSGREAMKEYAASQPDGKGTDMHILVWAGMRLNPARTPVKNGGVVVQVDGSYTASSGKGGVATVATVSRPDMSIKAWDDEFLVNQGKPGFTPVATSVDSSSVADPSRTDAEPEQEQIKLFQGITVMVPQKTS